MDNIDDHDFRLARTKANPFETIKNGIFQNRAAMKMANIDWACDFMFTDPKYSDGVSVFLILCVIYIINMCSYNFSHACYQALVVCFTLLIYARGQVDFLSMFCGEKVGEPRV